MLDKLIRVFLSTQKIILKTKKSLITKILNKNIISTKKLHVIHSQFEILKHALVIKLFAFLLTIAKKSIRLEKLLTYIIINF